MLLSFLKIGAKGWWWLWLFGIFICLFLARGLVKRDRTRETRSNSGTSSFYVKQLGKLGDFKAQGAPNNTNKSHMFLVLVRDILEGLEFLSVTQKKEEISELHFLVFCAGLFFVKS